MLVLTFNHIEQPYWYMSWVVLEVGSSGKQTRLQFKHVMLKAEILISEAEIKLVYAYCVI